MFNAMETGKAFLQEGLSRFFFGIGKINVRLKIGVLVGAGLRAGAFLI